MSGILKVLFFILTIIALISVSSGLFIGAGYLIAMIFSLSLFQASLLCIGSSFVFAFILFAMMFNKQTFKVIHINPKNTTFVFDPEDKDEYEDDDYQEEESHHVHKETIRPVRSTKVARNEPCPCGSGKKYKFCCGTNSE
ncbi:MAG: hypothetical protein DRR16_17245 [Candidatus Parabeggiatoa sp. nov. 3]|nr:MAG: hypothetical protein DRR00_08275 [Gammaproteobacteria bacterium]RKZ67914.1 MAG: hypothetical protein DRQ99_05360 [Gammaproteobacteria bacterium]RKZ83465.1 MAG: hypothetical protein DRR16_17245 [Gammaproteobacteria bacterium]